MLNTRFKSLAQEILFVDVAGLSRSTSATAMASRGCSFFIGTICLHIA